MKNITARAVGTTQEGTIQESAQRNTQETTQNTKSVETVQTESDRNLAEAAARVAANVANAETQGAQATVETVKVYAQSRGIISQPPIRLHTIPGEWGIPTFTVRPYDSIMRVAGWEVGNTFRMKYKALREGNIPLYTTVSLNWRSVGGQMVAVGGKSVARIIVGRETSENIPVFAPQAGAEASNTDDNEDFMAGISPEDFAKITQLQNIASRIQQARGFMDYNVSYVKNQLANLLMLAMAGFISDAILEAKLQGIENMMRAIQLTEAAEQIASVQTSA
jgi:hypothetical protein